METTIITSKQSLSIHYIICYHLPYHLCVNIHVLLHCLKYVCGFLLNLPILPIYAANLFCTFCNHFSSGHTIKTVKQAALLCIYVLKRTKHVVEPVYYFEPNSSVSVFVFGLIDHIISYTELLYFMANHV
jgi:hypothetical protein